MSIDDDPMTLMIIRILFYSATAWLPMPTIDTSFATSHSRHAHASSQKPLNWHVDDDVASTTLEKVG